MYKSLFEGKSVKLLGTKLQVSCRSYFDKQHHTRQQPSLDLPSLFKKDVLELMIKHTGQIFLKKRIFLSLASNIILSFCRCRDALTLKM